jgi:hypothetical protein
MWAGGASLAPSMLHEAPSLATPGSCSGPATSEAVPDRPSCRGQHVTVAKENGCHECHLFDESIGAVDSSNMKLRIRDSSMSLMPPN